MLYLDKGKTMNENVKTLKVGSCFTGIGGFELGLQYSFKKHFIDYNHEWFCEINKFSQKILKKHWPNVPIYDDVTKINKHELSDIDILDEYEGSVNLYLNCFKSFSFFCSSLNCTFSNKATSIFEGK